MKKLGARYQVKGKEKKGLFQNSGVNSTKKESAAIIHFASIRVKLILAFLVPVLFIILLGTASFNKAAQGIRSSYEQAAGQAINMATQYLAFGANSIKTLSNQYINDNEINEYFFGFRGNDTLESNSYHRNLNNSASTKVSADDFISNIIIISDKVKSVTTLKKQKDNIYAGFLETELGKELFDSKTSYWIGSNAYLDEKLEVGPDSYSLRFIRKLGGTDALIVIDMDMNTVRDILKSMEFDRTGTIGLITGDGKEIISGNQDNNSDTVFADKAFYKEAVTSLDTSGAYYVSIDGKDNLFIYSKLGETGSIVCGLIPKGTIMSQADGIKYLTVIIVIIACVLAVFTGLFISMGIDKTIKNIIEKLKMAASGDLTVDFSTKRRDEFKILTDEINHTFSNMKALIGQVKEMSKDVSEAATDVTKTSGNFLKTTQSISTAMNDIEKGITQQAEGAEECLKQMDRLSNKIVQTGVNTDEIGRIAEGTKRQIQEGTIVTGELNQQTKSTSMITTGIVRGIEELNRKSISIESIIKVINDISSQTNLLSLNASIEAARAGELGRGFAVVADEIRKLAEQTGQSVNDIKDIIESIQDNTKELVISAKSVENVLELQENAVRNTTESYQGINNSVDNLMLHLNSIIENVDNVEEARNSTLGAIENISAVLEEIAAASSNVTQISESQLQSVESLNQSAGKLNQNSEQLVQEVQRFVI
ncbi:hypothetical protein acsn021_38570 [Anaerocolumna cellulosilytica]|uniref:Uncharacterized protein n=1 Tax=Anaerocolumna cellulosilytica TaxID=433286 RepID=A0A6S6RBM1_9FIRM|nr:methyl-accepting chemotaxis protein [Anaerocolumna cellulosilytica]MBB5196259.1 methyl-accepting chemotaxis protein [Anaerocolumna cellulosilytica]BCJ96288.1 hypothetical protein acsn021_38570 [Anaerocolumna cellulosilytica]